MRHALLLALLVTACGPLDGERGHLVADPTAVFMPGAAEGSTSAATLDLINLGDGPLELRSVEVDGAGFGVSTCTLPAHLAPQQVCALTVRMVGQHAPASGRLLVRTDRTALEVPLVAPGSRSAVSLSPAEVDFGAVASGTTASRPLHLVNLGLGPACSLALSWEPGPGDFAASLPAASLGPGASADIVVRYSPTGGGIDRTTLLLSWSEGSRRIEVRGRQDLQAPH